MTREQILRNRLEMAQHNLYCFSADYSMDTPKEGSETEYKEALEEVGLLKAWLKEFRRDRPDSVREFIGHINTISYGKTYDGKTLADEIEFEVDTGARYTRGDDRIFHLSAEVQDWFIGKDRSSCGRYDIEKESRGSTLTRITVDSINYVRSIE